MKVLKYLSKLIILFLIGGLIYYLIEITWRGYSHISMFILGGLCFISLGLINEVFSWKTPLALQMMIGSVIITLGELATGCLVNILLKLNVWDYSNLPFNFLGQICLYYSILWFFLSGVGVILDDYIRYYVFNEEKPHYTII